MKFHQKPRLILLLLVCVIILCQVVSVSAQDQKTETTVIPEVVIVPKAEKTYNCGDFFEVTSMNEPYFSLSVGRKLTKGKTQFESIIKPVKGKLLITRIRIRNITHETVRILPESFKLTGYMYGKGKTYTPAAIQETDFRFMNLSDLSRSIVLGEIRRNSWLLNYIKNGRADISDLYVDPSVKYFFFNEELPPNIRPSGFAQKDMLPLRVWDVYVMFDVFPELEDWELSFEPLSAVTEETETDPALSDDISGSCKLTMEFFSVVDSTSGKEIRKFHK